MIQRSGHTIIEVLISISILAVATVSVGSLIESLRTTDRATSNKAQASALAQQSLEIATAIARQEFRCEGGACTTCTPNTSVGYTSCWENCPARGCTATYHVAKNAGSWSLMHGSEAVGTSPIFSRALTITPVDVDGQVKQITATVSWEEKSRTREATISTIVSAWQN